MKLRAERRGDRYVLNGTKMWITNAHYAETMVVYAKTDPEAGPKGITAFIVERGLQGLQARAEARQARHARLAHQRTGLRGLRGAGRERARRGRRRRARADVGPRLRTRRARRGPLGILQACLDLVVPYVHERKQFGQPIGEFQLIQGKLADMYTTLSACARLCLRRGARLRPGKQLPQGRRRRDPLRRRGRDEGMALDAIQILGGNGYIND
jgi:isovaleryl-CoA dehydrogenase